MKKVWSRQNKIMSYLYDTNIHLTRHILPLKFMWIFFRSIYDCSFTIFIALLLLYTWYIIQKFWTSKQWHPPITDLLYHHLFLPFIKPFDSPFRNTFALLIWNTSNLNILFFCANLQSKLWHHNQYRWRQKKCERRKFAVLR